MKVCIINRSDSRGGAAVASYRLMRALRRSGVDVRMLVMERLTDDPCVIQAGTPLSRKLTFLADTAANFAGNRLRRRGLFKIDSARFGLPLWRHPEVAEADIVVVEWTNQGMLSVDGMRRLCSLGKPVVRVMHDMWPMTGICHHAGECTRYGEGCGRCPLLGRPVRTADMSRSTWQRKMHAEAKSHAPVYVAVSRWLAECASRSSLLRHADVRMIPNPFPTDVYCPVPTLSRAELGLPDDNTHIIIIAAARLDDANKRLPLAIDTLNAVHRSGRRTHAVLVGEVRRPELLDRLEMPHTAPGNVADERRLAALFALGSVVLSTSAYESFGYTLLEGQSAGCVPVACGRGGQCDIIDSPEAGMLLPEADAAGLADAVCRALDDARDRRRLHELARRFDGERVARAYIELFDELLGC